LKRRFDLCVANGNPEYTCAIIDGDTPLDRRNEIIADFQSEFGSIRILLGNFKAMGVGITLTAASQMIILDEEWSPGKNEQAYDRIHRFGQEKSVTINILRVDNSVDEWMASLIEDKAALVDGFNNTVPMSASDLLSKLNDGML
jgi:SNF2 family DNA or RNA helicase